MTFLGGLKSQKTAQARRVPFGVCRAAVKCSSRDQGIVVTVCESYLHCRLVSIPSRVICLRQ